MHTQTHTNTHSIIADWERVSKRKRGSRQHRYGPALEHGAPRGGRVRGWAKSGSSSSLTGRYWVYTLSLQVPVLLHQMLLVNIGTRLSLEEETEIHRNRTDKKGKRGKNLDADGDLFTNTHVGGLLVTWSCCTVDTVSCFPVKEEYSKRNLLVGCLKRLYIY